MLDCGVSPVCAQSYSMAVYLVKQQSSTVLLQRLRAKGIRNPDHSRALSKDFTSRRRSPMRDRHLEVFFFTFRESRQADYMFCASN